jgi:hypothetical protein
MVGPRRAEALIRARPLSSWKTLPTLIRSIEWLTLFYTLHTVEVRK